MWIQSRKGSILMVLTAICCSTALKEEKLQWYPALIRTELNYKVPPHLQHLHSPAPILRMVAPCDCSRYNLLLYGGPGSQKGTQQARLRGSAEVQ